MNDSVNLAGKIYISARRASEISDYNSDYIGQLCRSKKLDCTRVGRIWFVTEESLLSHKENVLREERSRERILNMNLGRPISSSLGSNIGSRIKSSVSMYSAPELSAIGVGYGSLRGNVATSVNSGSDRIGGTSASESASASVSRKVLVFSLASVLVAGVISFGYVIAPAVRSAGNETAGVIDSIRNLFSITRWKSTFGFGVSENNKAVLNDSYSNNSNLPWNGMAVTSSQNNNEDAAFKSGVRSMFSDEVVVSPDESGTAGVITPVFKSATSTDFVYVLVPVDESEDQTVNGP